MKKLYVYVANGIGNFIQMTPSLQSCYNMGFQIDAGVDMRYSRTTPLIDMLGKCPFIKNVIKHPDKGFSFDKYDEVALFLTQEKCDITEAIKSYPGAKIYPIPDWKGSKIHESQYYMQLPLSMGFNGHTPPIYCPTDKLFHVDNNKRRISIAMSCLKGYPWQNKRWDTKKWGKLIESILRYYGDIEICILGGKGEEEEIGDILQGMLYNKNNIKDYAGKISITQSAKVISGSNILIAIDCGLSHIGAAVGAYVIVLFGPTLVSKNRQLTNELSIVSAEIDCSPCQGTQNFSKCRNNICMRSLSVGDVFNEIRTSGKL